LVAGPALDYPLVVNMIQLTNLAISALLCIAFLMGWSLNGLRASRDLADLNARHNRALADALEKARAIEHQLTAELANIGEHHAQQQHAAPAVEAGILADLRAGTLRLRREWQRCETDRVSDLAAATAERDAAAADRDALAAAIVRAGRDADQQLSACQAVIRAYREQ